MSFLILVTCKQAGYTQYPNRWDYQQGGGGHGGLGGGDVGQVMWLGWEGYVIVVCLVLQCLVPKIADMLHYNMWVQIL